MKKNKIIQFLEGNWYCKNIIVIPNEEIIKNEYKETMICEKEDILTITAYGIHDGKDVTKDMRIHVEKDDVVTLEQGDFTSKGTMIDNVVSLINNNYNGNKYVNRLYLMEDKYVYQMDVIKDGIVVQTQMSYLVRIK